MFRLCEHLRTLFVRRLPDPRRGGVRMETVSHAGIRGTVNGHSLRVRGNIVWIDDRQYVPAKSERAKGPDLGSGVHISNGQITIDLRDGDLFVNGVRHVPEWANL